MLDFKGNFISGNHEVDSHAWMVDLFKSCGIFEMRVELTEDYVYANLSDDINWLFRPGESDCEKILEGITNAIIKGNLIFKQGSNITVPCEGSHPSVYIGLVIPKGSSLMLKMVRNSRCLEEDEQYPGWEYEFYLCDGNYFELIALPPYLSCSIDI